MVGEVAKVQTAFSNLPSPCFARSQKTSLEMTSGIAFQGFFFFGPSAH
jgi:hypothetical protein